MPNEADEADLLSRAHASVREWNSVGGNFYGRGFAATSTAIFGPLLALFGPLMCVPATAHALGQPHVQPIALLGSLFFGTFGYLAIRKVKQHRWAVRYLAEHGAGASRPPGPGTTTRAAATAGPPSRVPRRTRGRRC